MIYMLNLLCAIVPCHATMKPPEAYIANFPPNYIRSDISTVTESIHILDPVLVQQNISNELQRIKRQNETVRIRYSSTSPKPPSPSLFPRWNIFREQQKTPQQYENLRNPFKTLMNAISKGVEEGSGFTHNFGNRFVPFPESNRVSGATGGNAKRNVNDNNRELKETLVYLRNGDAVEGYYMGTMKGHRLIAFEGIPYAESPVGNLRFRPPVPKRPWRGVLKATRPGSECLQGHPINTFRVSGSEDCLFLQIYTPQGIDKWAYDKKDWR